MDAGLRLTATELADVFGMGSAEQVEATLAAAGVDPRGGVYDLSSASAVFREKDRAVVAEIAVLLDPVRHDGDAEKILRGAMEDVLDRVFAEEWRRANPTLAKRARDADRAVCDRLETTAFYTLRAAKWALATAQTEAEAEQAARLWRVEIDVLRAELLAALAARRQAKTKTQEDTHV